MDTSVNLLIRNQKKEVIAFKAQNIKCIKTKNEKNILHVSKFKVKLSKWTNDSDICYSITYQY